MQGDSPELGSSLQGPKMAIPRLKRAPPPSPPPMSSERSREGHVEDEDGEAHGEAHVTASVGSNEDLDHLDEDLMRDHESRATGYVGLNSEVQWLRSAQRQTEDTGAEPYGQPHGPPGSTRDAASERSDALHDRRDDIQEHSRQGSMRYMNDTTFYLDSDDIETDIFVDPYEDPDPDIAEKLFNCYFETVHPSFPLTGALAFYFLVIGHVSRAWITIGISIRLALALGLHLRNEDPGAEESKKELLVRTWWSLQSTESLVSAITGRPPVIAFEDCTASLPRSLPGEQLNHRDTLRKFARRGTGDDSPHTMTDSYTSESGQRDPGRDHYLMNHINIAFISQKALLELYSPRTAARSWKSVQGSISGLLNELEEWSKAALPGGCQAARKKHMTGLEREQFLLKADYWSTKMLVTRPCLCKIERRIRNESKASVEFNKTSAEACVGAALEITKLFPDDPDLDFIYSKGPWWAIVHFIMQSIAVLILDMTYRNREIKSSEPSMVVSIRKLIRWLRAMRHNDPVAARAHHVIKGVLKRFSPALQSQADELLDLYEEETPGPDAYQHHYIPYNAQQTAEVPQENFRLNLMNTSSTFDPRPSQYYPLDNLPGHQGSFDPFYLPDESIVPMPFDNPFFTNFNHGVPFVNMQSLWDQPGYLNAFDLDLSHVNTSQDSHDGGQGSNVEYLPEQQQQQQQQQQHFEYYPSQG
ncbi:uncharacterized protein ALTATR162_LOCUS9381 [Alternaria atra]|uniref:Xylanolytic transcriptional activator regulatory domain-containing protein n=1 Tax=Alternaria atra TaxID=119953 RepID=A0A8J2I8F3_9PLEO|nr:uncharacterized protein ALTATR162_LOCUS9381 [Alternaria atra]CAG5179628.1 unnamed protein product [Alternaria atra]